MKLSSATRILTDGFRRTGLKQKYWDERHRWARIVSLTRPRNHSVLRALLHDQARFLLTGVKPVAGGNPERMRAAADWLLRAQRATPDDGVSFGYFPCRRESANGWMASYPETTGYVIETLLRYAARYGNEDDRDAALRMARWEAKIQMPSGAVQSGMLRGPERQTPAVFNTGMVLQGFTEALAAGAGDDILAAARRAADFLVSDMGEDGHFRTHGDHVVAHRVKTYNCLCGWALYRLGDWTGEERYRNAAVRAVEAAARSQRESGWFADNDMDRPEAPLLHSISYTLQGILEVALLAGREDLLAVVRRGVDPLVERISPSGFLHGRYYPDWEPASFSSCLTGCAQLAVVLYRLSETRGLEGYRAAADRIVRFLKALQRLDSPDEALNGALAGSFPLNGSYMTYGYPNWATKYFLDALLLQERLSSDS